MFNPEKRAVLPHSAFSGFASRFKAPKVTEGFGDVLRIEFQVKIYHAYAALSCQLTWQNSFRVTSSNVGSGASIGFRANERLRDTWGISLGVRNRS